MHAMDGNRLNNDASTKKAPTGDRIYADISDAIVGSRIPPGTILPEDALAGAFGVSRTVIRKVLLRLGHERLVDLRPNRSAAVAHPSPKEARDVFDARRVVETAIVEKVVEIADARQIADLRAHAAEEHNINRDRQRLIHHSGDFHLKLAAIAGNDVLAEFLTALIARSSLILALYHPPGSPPCNHIEHEKIVQALESRNKAQAVRAMCEHLNHIEERLLLHGVQQAIDFSKIFGKTP